MFDNKEEEKIKSIKSKKHIIVRSLLLYKIRHFSWLRRATLCNYNILY